MKILYTTEQFYPLQTGLATADYHFALSLTNLGHEVYVVTMDSFQNKRIERTGKKIILEEPFKKEAIEISPNLFVIEFDFRTTEYPIWCGEINNYRYFVQEFVCDLLIVSAFFTFTGDLLWESLNELKATKKVLRSHGESALANYLRLNQPTKPTKKQVFKDFIKNLLLSFGLTLKREPNFWHFTITNAPTTNTQKALDVTPYESYMPYLIFLLKRFLSCLDKVYFLHDKSHAIDFLTPLCKSVGILPNGVFQKDITPPKTILASYCGALTRERERVKALVHY
ncbi:hypothetical protein [Helicobacter cetorum]|uniref:hypothetical protein n=1 Tax=Helicobacter cetorum TaxID=138563 RepID=UPI00031A5FC4|nr:hypothetical protein [Helicobacter cetorum]